MARRSINSKTTKLNVAFMIFLVSIMVLPALASAYFGVGIHTAMSGSMRPNLFPGDELISDVVAAKDTKVGDIVLLLNPDNLEMEAHRIVSKTPIDKVHWNIITKGDANSVTDPVQKLHGYTPVRRVIAIIPKVGYVLDVLSSTVVKTIGGALLIGINIFFILKFRRREVVLTKANFAGESDQEIATKVKALFDEHVKNLVPPAINPTNNNENRNMDYVS